MKQNLLKANQYVDIGFNHILPSNDGAIMFGGCPFWVINFCLQKLTMKTIKLVLKNDNYDLKPKPMIEAKFLIWTGSR